MSRTLTLFCSPRLPRMREKELIRKLPEQAAVMPEDSPANSTLVAFYWLLLRKKTGLRNNQLSFRRHNFPLAGQVKVLIPGRAWPNLPAIPTPAAEISLIFTRCFVSSLNTDPSVRLAGSVTSNWVQIGRDGRRRTFRHLLQAQSLPLLTF